jgi:hypothetical protein
VWTVVSAPSGGQVAFADTNSPTTTATFSAAGTYVLRLSATDGTATVFEDLSMTVTGETYASWIAGEPGVNGQTGATQDPDADGVANLLEYALGTEPGNAASRAIPQTAINGSDHLTLTFTPQHLSGLIYLIEASPDLSDWTNQTDITSLLTPGSPYTHTDAATGDRRFLRLRVREP